VGILWERFKGARGVTDFIDGSSRHDARRAIIDAVWGMRAFNQLWITISA